MPFIRHFVSVYWISVSSWLWETTTKKKCWKFLIFMLRTWWFSLSRKGSPCCCLGWYSFRFFCACNYSVRQNLLQYFFDYLRTLMALPLPGVAHIAQQDIVTDVHPNLRSASLTSVHAEWLSHCPFGSVLPWICLLCCLWSTYQRYVACSKSNDSFLFLWKLQWI